MHKAFALDSTDITRDPESFKRQEAAFVVLNLFILAVLLLTHTVFESYWGSPPKALIIVLAGGFLLNAGELIWVQTRKIGFSAASVTGLTWASILLNMSLALVLAALSNRQDLQYFALLVVPVLKAAFRLSWFATVGVVAVAGLLDFYWVWWYFKSHPPVVMGEYFEAGTISLIYTAMGSLVWLLADNLRRGQYRLQRSLDELELTRIRLSAEEKLAAVGRLSSAIAHEVRNPVAMISSSLEAALAEDMEAPSRRDMLEIAAKEASRLEKLTGDFLTYARPDSLEKERCELEHIVDYVTSLCRPHAAKRSLTISTGARAGILIEIDPEKIEQALLNLMMNAMEASLDGGIVQVSILRENGQVRIDIDNANGPIPDKAVDLLFEPFFTTKSHGTGLGLAISRKIACAHGGDLALAVNSPETVRFSMTLPSIVSTSALPREAARE